MMRDKLGLAAALSFALASASCSAPASCDARQSAFNAAWVESEEHTGSLLLSAANESQTLHFRATLSDLPELWPSDGAVQSGALPLELSLSYENEPFGGDGRTEMPRLSVASDARAPGSYGTFTTSKYPGPGASSFLPPLFEHCTFGAPQCEAALDVQLQRLDGAPYPPLLVSWRATAKAHVGAGCSVQTAATHAALEVETP